MSSLWWLQPGWKDALCGYCGRNVWDAGGDPDLGACYECLESRRDNRRDDRQPMCDICDRYPAVSGVGGYGVCSQECEDDARRLIAKKDGDEKAGLRAGEDVR